MSQKSELFDYLLTILSIAQVNERKALLTAIGFDSLCYRIYLEVSTYIFLNLLLEEIYSKGQQELVRFLNNLANNQFLVGVDNKNRLNSFAQDVNNLTSDQWDIEFVGLQKLLILNEYEEYRWLQPFFDKIQIIVDAKNIPPKIISCLKEVVYMISKDVLQGNDFTRLVTDPELLVEYIQDLLVIYIQSNRNVDNDVRDHTSSMVEIITDAVSAINQTIYLLPIVPLVMKSSEAEELDLGSIFKGYPEDIYEDFKSLKAVLAEQYTTDWVSHYKDKSQEWQPFQNNKESLEQLIKRAISLLDGYHNIVPWFLDIHQLNKDNKRSILRRLRSDGCIVIMDVISMRHPNIQREFRRSLLDAFPKTMVARVAPINDVLRIEQMMITIIEQHIHLEYHKRYKLDHDEMCAEVDDSTKFERWFRNHVTNILPNSAKAPKGSRQFWYKYGGN